MSKRRVSSVLPGEVLCLPGCQQSHQPSNYDFLLIAFNWLTLVWSLQHTGVIVYTCKQ